MLPFGLRLAPKIFTVVADALEWCARQRGGIPFIDHYLDDFIIVGPPYSEACSHGLAALEAECDALGVPLAPEKKEGPSTRLTFLGIQIDTATGQLSLPPEKLLHLKREVNRWLTRNACKKAELESLIGTLQYAAKVIHPGRSFVRRLIDLLKCARHSHHHIRLNTRVKADLLWWKAFAASWNGTALFPPPPGQAPAGGSSSGQMEPIETLCSRSCLQLSSLQHSGASTGVASEYEATAITKLSP